MKSKAIGMMISSLIEENNSRNVAFQDHRAILLDLSNSLSRIYKKEEYREVLCNLYNNDIDDCTTLAIKKYLKSGDSFDSPNKDMHTNDAEVLIRVIPLALYISYRDYISKEKQYEMFEEVAKFTHAHPVSIISSMIFGTLLIGYIRDYVLDEEMYLLIEYLKNRMEYRDWTKEFEPYVHLDRIRVLHREEVSNSSYVVDSLTTAMWAVTASFDYESSKRILEEESSNNITRVISGALRGARYGYEQIDEEDKQKFEKESDMFIKIIKRYEDL